MIDIAIMKVTRVRGVARFRRDVDRVMRIIAIKFMWMPGIRPVIVPAKIPIKIASIRESSILSLFYLDKFDLFLLN